MKKNYFIFLLLCTFANAQQAFITTWNIEESDDYIEIEVLGDNVNYTIDFGDGTVLTNQTGNVLYYYSSLGTHTVTMTGSFPHIKIHSSYLSTVEQWGNNVWQTMESMFESCNNFVVNASDVPDLSQCTSMKRMFYQAYEFNSPIGNWDVSSVTNMSGMFSNTYAFNSPLDNWDVSNVTDMSYMFEYSDSFNQPLDSWDVSNVTNMERMFSNAAYFNQSLNNWDVSNVTNMGWMFNEAYFFNSPISSWDVSNVINMVSMFADTFNFNQPLNNWDVSNVTDMSYMFQYATDFNQPLDNWDVSNVTNMSNMFNNTDDFNQPLGNWDVSNVTNMESMFRSLFYFDQPLNNWDVSNVTDMSGMFNGTDTFNQDLSDWNFNNEVILDSFVRASALDTHNYDVLLLRFVQLQLENKSMDSYSLHYCNEGIRNYLIDVLNWTITGDSLGEDCEGNTITGTVLYDQDANGCSEDDTPAYNMLVKATDGTYNFAAVTAATGAYNLRVLEGTYTVEPLNLPSYFTASPASTNVTFTGFDNEEEINFCLTANETVEDLNITLLPLEEARPGFDSNYKLIAENIGTQTVASATVTFVYDEAIQAFVSSSETPVTNTTGQLTFTLTDILPLQTKNINITMNTFAPPTVNGDEVIEFITSVIPDTNDATPEDNTFTLEQIVVNSFDPNDKRVLQGEEIFIEQAGEYLDYIIRFQNTGTASAITVRIEDELSPMLDWTTFRPISASHDYELTLTNGNELEFIFNNINLPHEAADEPGSHGYIAYKIKPVAGLEIGDIINANAAEIFFDYNLPIITNSTTTEIVETLGIHQVAADAVQLYPNPAGDILNIIVANGTQVNEVIIYNMQGRQLLSKQNFTEPIDVRSLNIGMYMVSVKTNKGLSTYKLIKN
ncbi:BspA family leucine-rich repeat surface protein [Flavobacterium salilacus subsp. salilacus]|uniref:BspA family leucine-rich repeat surface protein n=1 Tax=Flavobacterium TaxID=237 RepID=UPI001074F2C3|nr:MULTISPECIES: BspA family leucine-rich repeat surface protein [Flavobacterium]KAF2519124.1 BspA family leucine-rich repeat surface protein [Flavobacterium salilacus subsp. salilacus]MBE1613303.1 BspA family leucine-rich repeat surface protein [Flavobacterium sp. SaA2.13]